MNASQPKPPKQLRPGDPKPIPIPVLLKPVCCPPSIAFNTLPELYFWIDWIAGRPGYAFGANRVPSGSFDEPRAMAEAGWVNMDYHMDGITAEMATVPREAKPGNRMIRMNVQPDKEGGPGQERPVLRFPGRGDPVPRHRGPGQEPDPDLGAGQAADRQHPGDGGHHRPRLDRRGAIPVPHQRRDPRHSPGSSSTARPRRTGN